MLTARASAHSSKFIERQKPKAEASSFVISARTCGKRWKSLGCCQYSKRVRPKLRLLQVSEGAEDSIIRLGIGNHDGIIWSNAVTGKRYKTAMYGYRHLSQPLPCLVADQRERFTSSLR